MADLSQLLPIAVVLLVIVVVIVVLFVIEVGRAQTRLVVGRAEIELLEGVQGLLEHEQAGQDRMRVEKVRALGVFGGGTEVEVEGEGRRVCEESLCEAGWAKGCV